MKEKIKMVKNNFNLNVPKIKTPKLDIPNFDLSLEVEEYEKKEGRKPIPVTIKRKRYYDSKGECMRCSLNFAREGLTEDYHHKDGNPANNNPNNIEVLCPNCHRKETFKQFLKKQEEKIKGMKQKPQNNLFKPIKIKQSSFQDLMKM